MLNATMERLPNGRRLRVARVGDGPPLVLLHGYPDNLQIWSALAPLLAGHFQVIAFDWPGMGQSEEWPGAVTPVHMADRLLELLEVWGITRATIVGLDMGGQPALAFAARHPSRTQSIVVLNSLVLWDEETSWEIAMLRRFGWNRWILGNLPRPVFERALRTFLPRGTRLPADLRDDLWESFRRPEVRRFIARLCAAYQGTLPKLPELYQKIACPTLLLWAEQDRHFPPIQGERLQRLIPGSVCEVIPGARHWMVWSEADEVARRILVRTPRSCRSE
ncbi:MAG TPA: alpha/beta hydrolase [Bryobacteraceae bacterium]|nr:alpha/beta hydrolase [Bryobacteraceae bacterium]